MFEKNYLVNSEKTGDHEEWMDACLLPCLSLTGLQGLGMHFRNMLSQVGKLRLSPRD